jgi:GTP pyrophosphokinase
MDLSSLVTGLLHDTLEDTTATADELEREFGKEVLELVEGVTKISKITFRTSEEKQAENFRKMLVAMAKDIRVVIVKLADRLHNMRTLQHLTPQKQVEIAQETLDIYAPLANRLGISSVRIELEDLCLRYLKPEVYYKLVKQVAKKKQERQQYIEDVKRSIHEKVIEAGLTNVDVSGRSKHFYSIFKKMQASNVEFEQVHDLLAFRIIVDTVTQCYEALGIVHALWKPVPGRFKDYIAMPKPNLYRSLHTTVIGPGGERVEVQIRTREMNEVAELGVAAHWKYKEQQFNIKSDNQFEWLRKLVQWQDERDPVVFLESVKLDLFQGEVYIFSPKGTVVELPVGSTPLDFAYAIHTEVGHSCAGAKVNGRMVPLKYELQSGDTVEIVRNPAQKPSKDWLKIAKTSRAKSKIRSYIHQQERGEARRIGEELLEKELRKYRVSLANVKKQGLLDPLTTTLSVATVEDLLANIGYGKTDLQRVVEHLVPAEQRGKGAGQPADEKVPVLQKIFRTVAKKAKSRSGLRVIGVDDMLIRLAKCCNPLPGDHIVGYVTRGRGVTVHAVDCPEVLNIDEDRRLEVEWDQQSEVDHITKIRVVGVDQPGLLTSMSKCISNEGVNIIHAECTTTRDKKAVNTFDLSVKDVEHLRRVMKELEKLKGVITVERVRTSVNEASMTGTHRTRQ